MVRRRSRPVQQLRQDVVAGYKSSLWHSFSANPLRLVPDRYQEGPFLTLDETVRFVRDFLGRSGSGGLASGPMSSHGPLADVDRL